MEKRLEILEPISRNVFETYLRLIEKIRLDIPLYVDKEIDKDQFIKSVRALDFLLNAIERSLQDITTLGEPFNFQRAQRILRDIGPNSIIYDETISLLESWILALASWKKDPAIVRALSYRFISVLNILENYEVDNTISIIRYLRKLSSTLENAISQSYTNLDRNFRTRLLLSEYNKSEVTEEQLIESINDLYSNSFKENSKRLSLMKRGLDPFDLPSRLQEDFIYYSHSLFEMVRYDTFNLRKVLEEIENEEDIQKIRKIVGDIDLTAKLDDLFYFDDTVENVIWEIELIFSVVNGQYRSNDIGFLLWTFSKALELVGDIEVELSEIREGSKMFKLLVRIKSLSAKTDLKDILKKAREAIEVYHTKKPISELRKFEAESGKLDAEAKKLEKETNSMMDEEMAKLVHDLSLQQQILDIERRHAEIEEKKAEIRLKNLSAIEKISNLIKEGIIQNDSSIKILINDILYINKSETGVSYDATHGDIELLDIKEKIENKDESES